MKKYIATIAGLTLLFFLIQVLDVFAFDQSTDTGGSFFGTWVSLLPPVVAILQPGK